jgi:hypothetical protein
MAGTTPKPAISGPAMAGPTKRATEKQSELAATAAGRSARGTMPGISVCRAGCAKEARDAAHHLQRQEDADGHVPGGGDAATSAAWSPIATCDAMASFTRSTGPPPRPASGLATTAGARSQKATTADPEGASRQLPCQPADRDPLHPEPGPGHHGAAKKMRLSRCESARPSAPKEAMPG